MAQNTTIPTLLTHRLELRGHVEADLDAAAEMWGHAEVTRYIGGRAFTREEVWHRILRYLGHWTLRPFGYWAVVERSSERFIGEIGLADWKRPSLAEYEGIPESGWALTPAAHGHGFAAEALRAVLAWADTRLHCPTICIINEQNVASCKLAEHEGYREVRRGDAGVVTFQRLPEGR